MILKPIEHIEASDISALVENKVPESPALEYKSRLPGSADSEKIKFLAEISAFANTRGGVLLAGINDVDGAPDGICGIQSDDFDAEVLRVEQIIRNGLSPRIDVKLRPIIVGEKTVLAIEIGKSWRGPHLVSFKDHSKFYGRNSAGKYPMDVYEIRDAFLSSETIPERIRQFRRDRANKLQNRDELPLQLYERSLLAIHVIPLAGFGVGGSETVSNKAMHRSMLQPPGATGWNNRINLDGVVTFSGRVGEPSRAYTQLFRNGVVEAVASIGYQNDKGKTYIHGSSVERYLLEGLHSYLDFYAKEDIPGPYYCFITLIDVRGVVMALDNFRFALDGPLVSDRSMLLIPEVVIESSAESVANVLRPKIDLVWNAFGMQRSPNFDDEGKWVPRD